MIHKYTPPTVPNANELEYLACVEYSKQNPSLITLLGSFWTQYYTDYTTLNSTFTAVSIQQAGILSRLSQSLTNINIQEATGDFWVDAYSLIIKKDELIPVGTDYFSLPITGVRNIKFMTSNLFNSEVILTEGLDYIITPTEIRFYVDIFNDPDIINNLSHSDDLALLWCQDIFYQNSYLYDRTGVYLYIEEESSSTYALLLNSIASCFTRTKSLENIEYMFNLFLGCLVSKYDEDTVLSITYVGPEVLIKTEKTIYSTIYHTFLYVQVGDKINKLDMLTGILRAKDHISDPEWVVGAPFPFRLLEKILLCEDGTIPPEIKGLTQREKPLVYGDPDNFYDSCRKYATPVKYLNSTVEYLDPSWLENISNERVYPVGNELQVFLYNLLDKILKYNVIYLQGKLSDHLISSIPKLYSLDLKTIQKGLPVYLYLLTDVLGDLGTIEDTVLCKDKDFTLTLSNQLAYSSILGYALLTYAGKYRYTGDVQFIGIGVLPEIVDLHTVTKKYNSRYKYNKTIKYNSTGSSVRKNKEGGIVDSVKVQDTATLRLIENEE